MKKPELRCEVTLEVGRKTVSVHPGRHAAHALIWDAMARLVPVNFVDAPAAPSWDRIDAAIFIGDHAEAADALAAGVSTLTLPSTPARTADADAEVAMAFADDDMLDRRLRSRSVLHHAIPDLEPITPAAGDSILATLDARPAWTARRVAGATFHRCAAALPHIADGAHPVDHLNGRSFIRLLPLLHFLRTISEDLAWTAPRPTACFMFDDPNLHWRSYGYIPYAALLAHAKSHGYHVSFATVPLDSWWVHSATARLFRDNPRHLSLLVHGNDHTFEELASRRASVEPLPLLAQSLRRVRRMEQRTGLAVDSAMSPPHEACRVSTILPMLRLGFEGAFISAWSLRDWNPRRAWPASFGLEIAERVDCEFPIVQRFRMTPDCQGEIMISAYLDRPIVAVGHHDSIAGGIELLSALGAYIDAFAGVTWSNPEGILRSLFSTRRTETLLGIMPHSARTVLHVPEGIEWIVLSPPPVSGPEPQCNVLVTTSAHPTPRELQWGTPIRVETGERIDIASAELGAVDYRQVRSPGPSVWPLVRRLLCEVRDRCAFGPGSKR